MTMRISLDTGAVASIALPVDVADRSVAAIVYDNEAYPDRLFRQIVEACRTAGIATAGVLQHLSSPDADRRCDVYLEDLSSGRLTALFENRGSEARGCRLDGAALADVTLRIENSLDAEPGLLVLNKFGKSECEGEGMRGVIAGAIARDIPVVIGVPRRNLEAWRDFAGELATELAADLAAVLRWLSAVQSGTGRDMS
jgi:Protein of unknown function (DUF2478)